MRIKNRFTALVVGKSSNVSSKNGQTYYNLAIACNGEAGNVGCPKEVFDAVADMKSYEFDAEYDSQWKTFRIVGLSVQK